MTYTIVPQRPDDARHFDGLLDRTFGTDRRQRTVYRLREGISDLPDLRYVAVGPDGELLASIRYWPILVETTPAILLGPLAVEPRLQGRGMGKALVRHTLGEARRLGHEICVVVGEPEYYGPYGFTSAVTAGLVLPGPVDPRRFQVLELRPGALDGVGGLIRRAVEGGEEGRNGGAVA